MYTDFIIIDVEGFMLNKNCPWPNKVCDKLFLSVQFQFLSDYLTYSNICRNVELLNKFGYSI